MSAYAWIPLSEIPNKNLLLAAATLSIPNKRTGEIQNFYLAEQRGDYIVMAKHLFSDWETKVKDWVEPALEFENAGFRDTIKLRDTLQEIAWGKFQTAENGILNLACGKGKTVLSLKKVADRNHPALVIVNNDGLITQWQDQAKFFLGLRDDQIGVVQQKRAEWDRPLVIAMIHTLAKKADSIPMEILQRFGTIIFDEVHHLSAETFSRTAALFYGNRYGLTATTAREDGLEPIYYAHVGQVFHSDLASELPAKLYFKKLHTRINMRHPDVLDKKGGFSMGKFYNYIGTLANRNEKILDEVEASLAKGRKVLVLTHSAAHPEHLKAMCSTRDSLKDCKLGAVSGVTPGPKRVEIIREADCTFATFQVAREALDVAALDTVLFVTPFQAWGGLQQGMGRAERKHGSKKAPVAVIFEDTYIPPAKALCAKLKRSIRANGLGYKTISEPTAGKTTN